MTNLQAFALGCAIATLIAFVPSGAMAQEFSISLGDEGSLSARTIQLFALITVLSLAPGLAIMVTCFPFLVTVLSILRQAIGLQQSPPNMLIVSLALFLTYFVMEPVFTAAWQNGIQPLTNEEIDAGNCFPAHAGALSRLHGGAAGSRHVLCHGRTAPRYDRRSPGA